MRQDATSKANMTTRSTSTAYEPSVEDGGCSVDEAGAIVRDKMRTVPILTYHSISRFAHPRFAKFTITPELFAQHLAYLHEQGYTSLTISQFAQAIRGADAELPAKPVILTFDDGFADFYANALPALEQHHFVATLYVVTGCIGGTSVWLRREGESNRPMLTWDELQDICARGIECGAHSHTHRPLDTLLAHEVREEATRSKLMLEDHLARPIRSFAYPYGFYTERTRAIVKQAGYSSACAVRYTWSSPADDVFALARFIITPSVEAPTLAALLSHRISLGMPQMLQMRTRMWRYARLGAGHIHRLAKEGRAIG